MTEKNGTLEDGGTDGLPLEAPSAPAEGNSGASTAPSEDAGGTDCAPCGGTGNPAGGRSAPEGADSGAGRRRRKGHPFLWMLLVLLLCCAGAGAWAWNEARTFLSAAPEAPGKSLVVDIEPGTTLAAASDMLQRKGVVTDALKFRLLAKYRDRGRSLQAGRFLVNTGWKPDKVLDMLVTGKAMLYRLTLREGLAWWEVADLLEKGGFCRAVDFTSVIHDPEFLRHWGIPFASAEGFLFPETYLLPHPGKMDRDAALAVANRLAGMFWSRADKVWTNGRPGRDDLRRIMILASIVEKETAVPDERGRVAGVYANRIVKGMLLQADPTVIYGLGRSFSGPLLKRHLEDPGNPYNTYRNAGLPPGPICSFGISALKAAVSPEQHDYLYFVATGTDGGHVFSRTLAEHGRAVQSYRAALKARGNP